MYEVVRTEGGWAVVRAMGGYKEHFGTRDEARARACEVCRQLAPARVLIRDPATATEEIIYGGAGLDPLPLRAPARSRFRETAVQQSIGR